MHFARENGVTIDQGSPLGYNYQTGSYTPVGQFDPPMDWDTTTLISLMLCLYHSHIMLILKSTTHYELMIRTTVVMSKRLASTFHLEGIFITRVQILCYQNCIKEFRIKAGYCLIVDHIYISALPVTTTSASLKLNYTFFYFRSIHFLCQVI